MGLEDDQIKEQLRKFSGRFGPSAIIPAIVTGINETDKTIAVKFSDGSVVDDVRLKAVIKAGDHYIIYPKSNSNVLVGKIENSDEYVLIVLDEIDKVDCVVSNSTMRQDGKFLFKNDAGSLLSLINELIDACLAEHHLTNTGPTSGLTPDAIEKYNTVKTKFAQLLSDE